MPTLQLPRNTTATLDGRTGSSGEIAADTTENQLRLYDGTTSGGFVIPNEDRVREVVAEENPASVRFSAKLTTTGIFANSVIVFNTAIISSPDYNTGTGVFTAPASGLYYFATNILRNAGVNNSAAAPFIRVNGTEVVGDFASTAGLADETGYLSAGCSIILDLSASDTVDVYSQGNPELLGSNTEPRTWFYGYKIQ